MNWSSPSERLALLELLVSGTLRKRRSQEQCWRLLSELPWVRRTGRRDEIGIFDARRDELVALLDRVWPTWGGVLIALTTRGLPPTPEGWSALSDAERSDGLPVLPSRINRRTAASLVAPHSKSNLTPRRLAPLGGTETTHDGAVRLRPPTGLTALTSKGSVDLTAVAAVLGEVSLPERALRGRLELRGLIRAVLLVENLGAFCDLPLLDGWLLAHVPGWDTATVLALLERLHGIAIVHFGDLDPNGVRIFQHLRRLRPDLRWFVPDFWRELAAGRELSCRWPDDLDLSWAPDLVREVRQKEIWLEQEPVAVDARTPAALATILSGGGFSSTDQA